MKILMALAIAFAPLSSFAEGFSGAYLGGVAGTSNAKDKGTGHNQGSATPNGWTQATHPKGILYGLMGGYNWMTGNNMLLGIEADYVGRGNDSDRSYQEFHGETVTQYAETTTLTSAASLRARVGYSFNSQALLYATAGYATAQVKRKWHDGFLQRAESHSGRQDGWTAGIGMEYLLKKNISAGLEYRYVDYGTKKVNANFWSEQYKQRLSEESLRVSMSYRF